MLAYVYHTLHTFRKVFTRPRHLAYLLRRRAWLSRVDSGLRLTVSRPCVASGILIPRAIWPYSISFVPQRGA